MGEYIRVRFRLRPALVGSPPCGQICGKTRRKRAKPGAKIRQQTAVYIANYRRQPAEYRRANGQTAAKRPPIGRPNVGQTTPYNERAQID